MPTVEKIAPTKHTVEMHKTSQRKLNPEKLKTHLTKIIDRGLAGGRAKRGWRCQTDFKSSDLDLPRFSGGEYHYKVKLVWVCEPKRQRTRQVIDAEWDNLVKVIAAAGNVPGWRIDLIDNRVAVPEADDRLPKAVGYVPVTIPPDWQTHTAHIYERDSQIDIILSAIQAGIESNFQDRFHCALIGDPACGKTETLRAIKAIVGEDAVLEYDATATTQAGAIKDLDERDELPRLLIVEEIEKTDENSLRWLLSVMDHRAEIRKLNFRSSIQKETRLLTLATVNDYKLFKRLMFGALASRFAYHLHFPKPDRAILQRILEREIARVKGDKRWIRPAIEFAVRENIYDPRKVTAICLCGREQLLDGSYQEKLKVCAAANFAEHA